MKLSIDDFDGNFRLIAETIGIEAAVKLSQAMGGMEVYIPKMDKLNRMQRDAALVNDFNGSNHMELVRKYNLSIRQVYEIIANARNPKITIENFLQE